MLCQVSSIRMGAACQPCMGREGLAVLAILKPEFSPHRYGQISWKKYYEIRRFLRIDDKTEQDSSCVFLYGAQYQIICQIKSFFSSISLP